MGTVFRHLCIAVIVAGLLLGPAGYPPVYAQARWRGSTAAPLSAQQLENLVGRIALYPDPSVAIVLPGSHVPSGHRPGGPVPPRN